MKSIIRHSLILCIALIHLSFVYGFEAFARWSQNRFLMKSTKEVKSGLIRVTSGLLSTLDNNDMLDTTKGNPGNVDELSASSMRNKLPTSLTEDVSSSSSSSSKTSTQTLDIRNLLTSILPTGSPSSNNPSYNDNNNTVGQTNIYGSLKSMNDLNNNNNNNKSNNDIKVKGNMFVRDMTSAISGLFTDNNEIAPIKPIKLSTVNAFTTAAISSNRNNKGNKGKGTNNIDYTSQQNTMHVAGYMDYDPLLEASKNYNRKIRS